MSSWKPGRFLRLVGAGMDSSDQTGSEPAERKIVERWNRMDETGLPTRLRLMPAPA